MDERTADLEALENDAAVCTARLASVPLVVGSIAEGARSEGGAGKDGLHKREALAYVLEANTVVYKARLGTRIETCADAPPPGIAFARDRLPDLVTSALPDDVHNVLLSLHIDRGCAVARTFALPPSPGSCASRLPDRAIAAL